MTKIVFGKEHINIPKLNHFLRTLSLLDPPQGIIPPPIISYKKYPYLTYDPIPYDLRTDYWGKSLDTIKEAVLADLKVWNEDITRIDRVGIWLSGGIDSALLLKYTVDLLGPNKVIAYNMKFGEKQDETDYAQTVCDALDVKLRTKFVTPQDAFPIVKIATYWFRAPTWCPHVYLMGQWCNQDGTNKCFIGLGLDAMTGGEWRLYKAQNDPSFYKVEEADLMHTQLDYHWANFYQVRDFVDLKCPYMDSVKLVNYLKSLPIHHKVEGTSTKLRIRREIADFKVLPEKNTNYGLKAGTKKGFGPDFVEWFRMGYNEWSLQHDPADKGFDTTPFGNWKQGGNLWNKLMLASTYYFYELIDEGAFAIDV